MLDLKFVRENQQLLEQMLQNRRSDLELQPLLTLDQERRQIIQEVESLKHERKVVSDQIAQMKKSGEDATETISHMRQDSQRIKELDQKLGKIEDEIHQSLLLIPNVPHESVPVGKDEHDNPVVKRWGEITEFSFAPKPHWELGENLGILDFERAAKMTGARFTLYWGLGA
ncbi:MAG: serine--tRNA ligase, partial [Deltaproteobacteria bacterium]|nr:serine--tRNA ligase [Deltaproteobacteria bacterium]